MISTKKVQAARKELTHILSTVKIAEQQRLLSTNNLDWFIANAWTIRDTDRPTRLRIKELATLLREKQKEQAIKKFSMSDKNETQFSRNVRQANIKRDTKRKEKESDEKIRLQFIFTSKNMRVHIGIQARQLILDELAVQEYSTEMPDLSKLGRLYGKASMFNHLNLKEKYMHDNMSLYVLSDMAAALGKKVVLRLVDIDKDLDELEDDHGR